MPKVYLYTTPTCPYCIALKNFLKEHNIKFEEIDVSVDEKTREELIQKTNQFNVPVVEIDGEIIIGFDKEKISKLLNIR
ncbi:MAG TPA: glutaredoxin domain-containing protein [Candidatus Pacearchaeota archaeon]|nr:glutaredoxin domain-containing protein [Candidatus Pacearchaeota archaeon]HOK94031.1 glutaredoxin domain-containing protein [Candidatus Pacearchaeota archaeon]HPO75102.1 glutaredoxin domain-containing protein [Candidatus Pacearchaeota archaeon]